MAEEEYRHPMKEFLDMLADLMAEKYFERMDDRMKKIPELRRLITAKEASQFLSLSTETVYRMAATKKLPYLKVGDRVLFDLKALDHWVDRHMVREKEWKKQELKLEPDKSKPNAKSLRESDLLDLLKKKRKRVDRMLKNAHLLRFPHPSAWQRTFKYASLPSGQGAIREPCIWAFLSILGNTTFQQPDKRNCGSSWSITFRSMLC